jgi:hypothetical protein
LNSSYCLRTQGEIYSIIQAIKADWDSQVFEEYKLVEEEWNVSKEDGAKQVGELSTFSMTIGERLKVLFF